MAKAPPTVAPPRGPPSAVLRGEIEAAEASGVARTSMVLRLTLGDAIKLKRDPGLALTDISFTDGVMRYLGVEVEQGGVSQSVLDASGAPRSEAAKPKAKVQRKKASNAATPQPE